MNAVPSATTSTSSTAKPSALHPLVAALAGAVTFGVAMTTGGLFDLNADSPDAPPTSFLEIAAYAGLVLVAVAISVGVALWALHGSPGRVSATALGLALAAVVTFVAFWSGWPHVFGAVACVLALEHRRRIGSFAASSLIALVLGGIAWAAATAICVLG